MTNLGDFAGRVAVSIVLALPAIAPACRGSDETIADPPWLRERLEKIRQKHRLPALAAAVVVDGKVVAASAVGVRRWGSETRVTRDDAFQLGSVTKTMTATMIGRLVDRGLIRWDTTIAAMFPELVATMNPAYRDVTVAQLLSHSSGMPYTPRHHEPTSAAPDPVIRARRYQYVETAVTDPPEVPPGTKVIYSGGPVIVASALERMTGKSYEELMRELVFGPLGMTSAGFGDNAKPGRLDAPWDHTIKKGGHPVPVPPNPGQDHQARAPVGRNVHCSVIDLARFCAAHLAAPGPFLSAASMERLHTPVKPVSFAPGWHTEREYWADGTVLSHNGSTGHCHAQAYVVPAERFATCILTNVEGEGVSTAVDEVNRFLVTKVRRGQTADGGPSPATPEGSRPPAPDVPLDDLKPEVATTGFGHVLAGKNAAGAPMTLDGNTYARGIGVHAPSELAYALRPEYRRFVARVGIDDHQYGHGSVRVEVFVGGRRVAASPLLRGGDPPWPVDVPLPDAGRGEGTLRLVVGDGGDGKSWDLTDWVDAGFVTRPGN